MAKLAERGTKFGNVFKDEEGKSQGYCRKVVPVLLSAGSDIGDVVYDDGGVYTLVNQANVASAVGIIADAQVESLKPTSGTATVEAVIVYRGRVVVAEQALNFGADVTDAGVATALNALDVVGITSRTQV